ncbi:MAG: hydroxyisourate hydrolase [Trueperaceae bacterium]|nr:MAG: hydroxyisourate hydrolase [Trueperaceae bacterium]
MGRLSTHVLDTAQGRPAHDLRIDLYYLGERPGADVREHLGTFRTNEDGRTDTPLLAGDALRTGYFELAFHIGPYFSEQGLEQTNPSFLHTVPVRFGLADTAANYHVPLLASPYGYSTYRGS